jgi:hypothetical protein
MTRRILNRHRLGPAGYEADKAFIGRQAGVADRFRLQAFSRDEDKLAAAIAQVDRAYIRHHGGSDQPDHIVEP